MEHRSKNSSFDPKVFLSKGNFGRRVSAYKKSQVVYRQGDPADSVFYILTGEVKLSVTSEQGKEAVIAVLGPDEFFGEGCLHGEIRHLSTAITLTACTVAKVTSATMSRIIREEPTFAEFFILHLLNRNNRLKEDLVDQLFNSSEKRLARILLLLANFGGEGVPEPVLQTITQATLAEMVGTTRSRINFFMNKFRRLGLIDYNGKIRVHRSLLDLVLHEQPEVEKKDK